jgi:3'-phosphoadenosine 5'-phosphosulfate (PAPS) 3'-phosphatase
VSRETEVPPALPENLPELLRDALAAAAVATLARYESLNYEVESKKDATPLTTADLEANQILETRLQSALRAAWLSEESADNADRLAERAVWIVDPIDGTREFIERTGGFSVSVGLSFDGAVRLGGVALPTEGLVLVGEPGAGLSRWRFDRPADISSAADEWCARARTAIGSPIALTPVQAPTPDTAIDLSAARILVSQTEWKRGVFEAMARDLHVEPQGSIARKLALVADGRGDLVVSLFPKSEWDICGGAALILAQPDAVMLELQSGAPHRFNRADVHSYGLVAGPRPLAAEFLEYFRSRRLELRRSY